MRRAGDKPISVDPASAEFLREVGRRQFPRLDARRDNPVPQRRGSCGPRGLDRSRNPGRAPCEALSDRRHQARRGRRRGGCKARAAGVSMRRRSRRSTPPARVTPLSPAFSRLDCPARTFRSRSSAPPQPAPSLRQLSAEGRRRPGPGRPTLTVRFRYRQIGLAAYSADAADFTINPAAEKSAAAAKIFPSKSARTLKTTLIVRIDCF